MPLRDVRHIKRVFGLHRATNECRNLTDAERQSVADVVVELDTEPMQYVARSTPDGCPWMNLIVVVDTESSVRGREWVEHHQDGHGAHPIVSLDAGAYYEQQRQICKREGQCETGCGPSHLRLRHGVLGMRLLCRHTHQPCQRVGNGHGAARLDNLELLLDQCRDLRSRFTPEGIQLLIDDIGATIDRIDNFKPIPGPPLDKLIGMSVTAATEARNHQSSDEDTMQRTNAETQVTHEAKDVYGQLLVPGKRYLLQGPGVKPVTVWIIEDEINFDVWFTVIGPDPCAAPQRVDQLAGDVTLTPVE